MNFTPVGQLDYRGQRVFQTFIATQLAGELGGTLPSALLKLKPSVASLSVIGPLGQVSYSIGANGIAILTSSTVTGLSITVEGVPL